jgi:hypothetical protein
MKIEMDGTGWDRLGLDGTERDGMGWDGIWYGYGLGWDWVAGWM